MGIKFLTGSEAALLGAIEGGAQAMFGYPITPSSEILQGWAEIANKDKSLDFLQTEDETAAGFATIGAILAGKKAFTATAGPGNILMQDPLSMSENLRIPFVCIIMQRGGPSTGTVNFSQQEVTLSAFGGNGDGLRVVYSASTVEEMYKLTAKAFSTAWKYRFPTFVLGDGHLSKMKSKANISPLLQPIQSRLLLKEKSTPTFLRNCFSSEESFYNDRTKKNIEDWQSARSTLVESELYKTSEINTLVIAHGSVADAVKDAIDIMKKSGIKIGLFRPITLNPFDTAKLRPIANKVSKIYIIESSLNQLSRIVKYELSGISTPVIEISKPAVSFTAEEIVKLIAHRN